MMIAATSEKDGMAGKAARPGHPRRSHSSLFLEQHHPSVGSPLALPSWDPSAPGAIQPERRYSAISRHHMAMMARNTRLQYLLISFVALLVLITYNPAIPQKAYEHIADSIASRSRSDKVQAFGELVRRPQDAKERVTLIAVYGGSKQAAYLPLLFQTAAQNQRSLDLLFVNVDQGVGCIDSSYITDPSQPTYAPNIKHLCLTEVENDRLYTQFICKGWEKGCDHNANVHIMNHLADLRNYTRKINDEIFNTFKPWRGLVYKEHLRTEWWGWFDADQLIGNFEHLLPKDIMNNFDMVMPAHSNPVPNALFLPGQLTLIKNNDKMARMPYKYKPLSALEHIHLLQPGSHTPGLDEGEYSDLFINRLKDIDILRVPDLQGSEPLHGDRRVIIVDGHVLNAYRHIDRDDIQAWFNRIHDARFRSYRIGDTISEYGKTLPLRLSHTKELWCSEMFWNPINTCPEWKPSHASRTLVYRKDRSEWKIRREPPIYNPHEWQFTAMEPKMFIHFLLTKVDVDDWRLPSVLESGYRKERTSARFAPGDGLRTKGSKVAVFEMSKDWWGTWQMTAGDLDAPRGFDRSRIMRKQFEEDPSADYYWNYHHWNATVESPLPAPPPYPMDPWKTAEAEIVDSTSPL